MYRLSIYGNSIIRVSDNACIPVDLDNGDYKRYLDWVAQGNAPEPTPSIEMTYPQFKGNDKLDLFTPSEQLAVVTATMTDPIVKLMYDRLLGSAYMTYEDPETERGLVVLVDKGLLTQERKAEIVAAMQPR